MDKQTLQDLQEAARIKVTRRRFTVIEKILIDAYLAQRLHDAEKAMRSLQDAYEVTKADFVRANIAYWKNVVSGLKWALAFVDPTNPKPNKRSKNGNELPGSPVVRGSPADGGKSP